MQKQSVFLICQDLSKTRNKHWNANECYHPPTNNCTLERKQMQIFFFFHIMQKKFHRMHIPHIMHECWQSLQFCLNFNHLRVVLIICYKHMHLIIHFTPGAHWLFLHTSFPFSAVQNSHKDTYCQQHITCSIFKLQFKNPFSNMFSHLHITMNSTSTE